MQLFTYLAEMSLVVPTAVFMEMEWGQWINVHYIETLIEEKHIFRVLSTRFKILLDNTLEF